MNNNSSNSPGTIANAFKVILDAVGNQLQLVLAIFIILTLYLYFQKDAVGLIAHYLVIALAFFIVAVVGLQCRHKTKDMHDLVKKTEQLLKDKEEQLQQGKKLLEEKEELLIYKNKLEEAFKELLRD